MTHTKNRWVSTLKTTTLGFNEGRGEDVHGGVDEQTDGDGQAFEAVSEEMIEHGVRLRMGEEWFGYGSVG